MSMTSSKSTSQLFPSEKLHYSTSCHKTPSKGSLEVAFSDKDMWNYCTFKQVIDATSKRGCHQVNNSLLRYVFLFLGLDLLIMVFVSLLISSQYVSVYIDLEVFCTLFKKTLFYAIEPSIKNSS